MYSVLLLAAFSTAEPSALLHRRAAAGCAGSTAAVRSTGCQGQSFAAPVVAVQASGCQGSFAAPAAAGCAGTYGTAHVRRTPVRTAVHNLTAPRARAAPATSYYAPTATYIAAPAPLPQAAPPLPPVTQSAAPPVKRSKAVVVYHAAPARGFFGSCCPSGNCPRR